MLLIPVSGTLLYLKKLKDDNTTLNGGAVLFTQNRSVILKVRVLFFLLEGLLFLATAL